MSCCGKKRQALDPHRRTLAGPVGALRSPAPPPPAPAPARRPPRDAPRDPSGETAFPTTPQAQKEPHPHGR